jgi:hypothetical protein
MKRHPYLIKSVAHAAELISAFESHGEILSEHELLRRTGLSRGVVHRVLYTLEKARIVEKPGAREYRLLIQLPRRIKWKIGYGAPGIESTFVREVTQSSQVAVERSGEFELLVLEHRNKPSVMLHVGAT